MQHTYLPFRYHHNRDTQLLQKTEADFLYVLADKVLSGFSFLSAEFVHSVPMSCQFSLKYQESSWKVAETTPEV